jgi:hypothetical protein
VVPAVDDEPSRASSKEASAARGKSGARATTPARRTD